MRGQSAPARRYRSLGHRQRASDRNGHGSDHAAEQGVFRKIRRRVLFFTWALISTGSRSKSLFDFGSWTIRLALLSSGTASKAKLPLLSERVHGSPAGILVLRIQTKALSTNGRPFRVTAVLFRLCHLAGLLLASMEEQTRDRHFSPDCRHDLQHRNRRASSQLLSSPRQLMAGVWSEACHRPNGCRHRLLKRQQGTLRQCQCRISSDSCRQMPARTHRNRSGIGQNSILTGRDASSGEPFHPFPLSYFFVAWKPNGVPCHQVVPAISLTP